MEERITKCSEFVVNFNKVSFKFYILIKDHIINL